MRNWQDIRASALLGLPKDICLFWVSLVLETVGFERVHTSTRGYSICAYEH